MKESVESAIKTLVESIKADIDPHAALKITQSALNLAHVNSVMDGIKRRAD